MKRRNFQKDDFISDSVIAVDSHISFEGYFLKNYSVELTSHKNQILCFVTLMFDRKARGSEKHLIERMINELESLYQGMFIVKKIFQFDGQTLYCTINFSKGHEASLAFSPILLHFRKLLHESYSRRR